MTIDHAAEARDALTTAHDFAMDEEFAFADLTLKAAQVHATLALVEQQRIANLIAAFQMEGGPYKEANDWTDGEEDANVSIRRQVREGLGL